MRGQKECRWKSGKIEQSWGNWTLCRQKEKSRNNLLLRIVSTRNHQRKMAKISKKINFFYSDQKKFGSDSEITSSFWCNWATTPAYPRKTLEVYFLERVKQDLWAGCIPNTYEAKIYQKVENLVNKYYSLYSENQQVPIMSLVPNQPFHPLFNRTDNEEFGTSGKRWKIKLKRRNKTATWRKKQSKITLPPLTNINIPRELRENDKII